MLIGLPALENANWPKLHHAYGRALDTPQHLRALLDGGDEAIKDAVSHLCSAIIHQGTPWTATEPAALTVAGFLSDKRIDRCKPLRAHLFAFLASVAEASVRTEISREELEKTAKFDLEPFLNSEDDERLFNDENASNAFYARSVLGCMKAAPELIKVMLEGLKHLNPRVRTRAAMGAVMLTNADSLRDYAKSVEIRLLWLAQTTRDIDERSAHVLALGDLGYAPIEFLHDPSPAVRMCAALAPGFATNPAALRELLNMVERQAGNIDTWFKDKPPQFAMCPRFAVVARLVESVADFAQLANAAIALVKITTIHCVDFDWGPLLAAAFKDGDGQIATEAQRRFLAALVKNQKLWDAHFSNPHKWFKKAGLPYDRNECAKMIK
ncbi:hypothetical protein U14_00801 [Candidatus Moduliflexus flocculans]|uniref:PBS lyase HEAT domain protein repeat-containing protein n=1 Tax=Candidatus Moduliflexus flocculans TaxID=1499966 RepID=A0A0S6VQS8_9BACT|nr:hypothetical protein U14_00801 [Candidatus Moduliflexus flocculans]